MWKLPLQPDPSNGQPKSSSASLKSIEEDVHPFTTVFKWNLKGSSSKSTGNVLNEVRRLSADAAGTFVSTAVAADLMCRRTSHIAIIRTVYWDNKVNRVKSLALQSVGAVRAALLIINGPSLLLFCFISFSFPLLHYLFHEKDKFTWIDSPTPIFSTISKKRISGQKTSCICHQILLWNWDKRIWSIRMPYNYKAISSSLGNVLYLVGKQIQVWTATEALRLIRLRATCWIVTHLVGYSNIFQLLQTPWKRLKKGLKGVLHWHMLTK